MAHEYFDFYSVVDFKDRLIMEHSCHSKKKAPYQFTNIKPLPGKTTTTSMAIIARVAAMALLGVVAITALQLQSDVNVASR